MPLALGGRPVRDRHRNRRRPEESLVAGPEPGTAHLVPIGFACDHLGQAGHPAGMPWRPQGGRAAIDSTAEVACGRPLASCPPSSGRMPSPHRPSGRLRLVSAPRSLQGGKDAEKHRADLDYPCRKPAAAARSPRNDQREGGRPTFRPFALWRTGQERCPTAIATSAVSLSEMRDPGRADGTLSWPPKGCRGNVNAGRLTGFGARHNV